MSAEADLDRRRLRRIDELEDAVRALLEAIDSTTLNPVADAAVGRAKQHLNTARQLGEEPPELRR